MRIDIVTLFPGMFKGPLSESMIKIAERKEIVGIHIHNLRDWTNDKHRTADDKPYGGGSGMVMKVEPVFKALQELDCVKGFKRGCKGITRKILMTPQGKKLDQRSVRRLSKIKRLIIVCGHYEGVDERIRGLVDEEISIGDYILTGGEIPACVLVDSIVRLLPGVLGDPAGAYTETFECDLLEYPQYTRPSEFEGMKVPDVLLGGNHKKISLWREKQALKRTKEKRIDLYRKGGDR